MQNTPRLNRRQFVTGASALGLSTGLGLGSTTVQARSAPAVLQGSQFELNIGYQTVNFTGRERIATTVNGSLPAPTLRWREGDTVTLRVNNQLKHDSSIHWHGLILPSAMDGVPGLSFAGIKPSESFEYRFTLQQSGTYWYHSHSGFQEQTGLYGAIIIDPKDTDPVDYDRDHVILLSDWSDEDPTSIYAKLKKQSHVYNTRERNAADLLSDISNKGLKASWRNRKMWNQMRMSDSDLADVTGATYTFLMNGATPQPGWQGLFNNGEKVRLRIINAAAMSIFDFRIPGLKLKVVAADGQNIQPVSVDEFRIAPAETYDVVVEPEDNRAYTLFAQTIDRSGYACGSLTPGPEHSALIPDMDVRPTLSHRDMGMQHRSGHHQHQPATRQNPHQHHAAMQAKTMDSSPAPAGKGSTMPIFHGPEEVGPHIDMRSPQPQSGLDDPGIGLRDHARRYQRRVLRYSDLRKLTPTADRRDPSREIQIHLTGNMARYMWSMDGIKYADAEPIVLSEGERLRITLVNDTMMTHPIHLHGMWSELETGDAEHLPRKHTIIVQPGSTISYLVTADAVGRWAYHCHLLYHMPSMMREVQVRPRGKR